MKSFDEIANRVRVLLSASVLAAMAAGCATSSMKSTPFYRGSERVYTGRIEDRVNLWPIGYYREPALSVLWPLFSLTDDHLAIRPLYSQYRQGGKDSDYNEFNFLWPFCQFDTKHHKHRVFPFYWGDRHVGLFPIASWRFGKSARLFPIVWWEKDRCFNVFPLWWSDDDSMMLFPLYYQGEDSLGVFPLFYHDPRNFASLLLASGGDAADNWWAVPPLLSWGGRDAKGSFNAYLLGLCGYTTGANNSSQWLFPLFYHDDDTLLTPFCGYIDDDRFYSPLWISWHNEAWNTGGWAVPLLLSWGSDGFGGWSQNYLLGLGGVRRYKNGGYSDWVAPLYYRSDDAFATLLFGWSSKCSWVAPLYYNDDKGFLSLPYFRFKGHDGPHGEESVAHLVLPLLSWVISTDTAGKQIRILLGLGGLDTAVNGKVDCSWLFPLYYNDRGGFISLLFSHEKDAFTCVTPFFGVTHGRHRKGAWAWPFYGWVDDDRMQDAQTRLNASSLDPELKIEEHGKTFHWYAVTGVENDVNDESWFLCGLGSRDRTIRWHASNDGKVVSARDSRSFGNFLAVKGTDERVVGFDYKTREKISDEESGELGVLCNLLWHSKYEKVAGGRSHSKKSILWRFWHYENTDGNVSVDSFPFFTYDSKTDGYSKTSLLWRLFRNEYDPKSDRRSVDFLFIPVWR